MTHFISNRVRFSSQGSQLRWKSEAGERKPSSSLGEKTLTVHTFLPESMKRWKTPSYQHMNHIAMKR